jgi:hypothetical protein
MNIPNDAKLVLLGEENSGRDEMNLAGNPFALLQAASKNGQTFIENEWERRLNDGQIVKASWYVNGDQRLGLPGPSEEMLYLVLLGLTRESADEQGIWPQTVYFSRYDLVKRMKWSHCAANYRKLEEAFTRLKNVSITAKNAFWDARTKAPFKNVGFNLIDNFAITNESAGLKGQGSIPLSYFKWNDILYNSFRGGNVRSLALDFAISLHHPTSIRLFRYLDMMRGATTPPRREFAIGVLKLCERLGMTSYKYASKIKEKLRPAIEELEARGYLESVRYEKGKDGTELAFFRFAGIVRVEPKFETIVLEAQPAPKTPAKPHQMALLEEEPQNNIQADALRCHELFQTLPESEQAELLELARREVSPIWHDRVGQPESPMSLGLWQLVAQRYGERLK